MAEIVLRAADGILFRQEVRLRTPGGGSVVPLRPVTLFQPSHSVVGTRRYLPGQKVTFSQSVSAKKVYRRTVHHGVSFGNVAKRPVDADARSAFFCWQTVTLNNEAFAHAVPLSQSVTVHKTRGTSSRLELADSVSVSVTYNRSVVHSLDARSSAVGYELDRNVILQQVPTTVSGQVVLTFGSLELRLRAPRFGDADRLQHSSVSRRTRGNKLVRYRDRTWPRSERLSMDFEWLSEADVRRAQYFLGQCLGRDVSLTDHRGLTWTGFVTTPDVSATQDQRRGYSMSLEFEGTRT